MIYLEKTLSKRFIHSFCFTQSKSISLVIVFELFVYQDFLFAHKWTHSKHNRINRIKIFSAFKTFPFDLHKYVNALISFWSYGFLVRLCFCLFFHLLYCDAQKMKKRQPLKRTTNDYCECISFVLFSFCCCLVSSS